MITQLLVLVFALQPASAPAPATQPVKIDLSTPVAAMRSAAQAMRNGDGAAFAKCADARDEGGRRLLAAMLDWIEAGGRLERAVHARFDKGDAFDVLDAIPVLFNPWGLGEWQLEELNGARPEDVEVRGGRAVLTTSDQRMEVTRADGQWKLPMSGTMQDVRSQVNYYEQAARHYRHITKQIEAGAYPDADAAVEAIEQLKPGLELPSPATQGR